MRAMHSGNCPLGTSQDVFFGAAGSLIGSIGDGTASPVAAVINLAAFGGAVFGHPIGATFGAANIMAIDTGAGHAGTSGNWVIRL